jgi:nitroimidazol reductase NimA-like FMN-containing flavoprotein (pyridoxamine 5'-phosphate oxidase superfamily)
MLRSLARGIEVCVTVTLVDGLVLARSAFHHSINYRSVVILGRASAVEHPGAKAAALECFTEHLIRGRWADVRPPSEQELKATLVLSLPLVECSAKVRTGPPLDDVEDQGLEVWAGVLPLKTTAAVPIDDPGLRPGIAPPSYTLNYARGKQGDRA